MSAEAASIDAPPQKNTYKFDVKMSCSGCSGAVTRALSKKEGIDTFNVSLDKQEVRVTSGLPYDDVLDTIKKTGKEVLSGSVVAE
ncbi:copper chaperone taha [Cantharellus anzutake]|uniref:copper chaperone taha n=1 Tax=Cantharellus anzutake TaxID=1750568 RepID=UPI001904B2DC|nr:copper chaperone taha [Cantharellus anzutake]KAF8334272.1 copper chaperone taha [Cantharellus anzutake]